jgi:hypothetical protein
VAVTARQAQRSKAISSRPALLNSCLLAHAHAARKAAAAAACCFLTPAAPLVLPGPPACAQTASC